MQISGAYRVEQRQGTYARTNGNFHRRNCEFPIPKYEFLPPKFGISMVEIRNLGIGNSNFDAGNTNSYHANFGRVQGRAAAGYVRAYVGQRQGTYARKNGNFHHGKFECPVSTYEFPPPKFGISMFEIPNLGIGNSNFNAGNTNSKHADFGRVQGRAAARYVRA